MTANGYVSGGGGGSGTVTSVAGVSPDGAGNVPLTPAAIGAALASDLTAFEATLGTASTQNISAFDASGSASTAQAYAIARAHHTGTQTMSTISDAGTAATKNVGSTTGTVAAGDDSRFTDTRTPTDNTVTSAKIVDGTIVNGDISGSAAIVLSKLATDPLARANHTGTQTASTISDFSTAVLLTAPPTLRQVATSGLLSGGGALSADLALNTLGLGAQPDDFGYIDWSFDPQIATSTGTVPTSGLLYVTKFRMRAAKTISNVYMLVGTTGTTPSNVIGGLYDATGTAISGASASVTPATWNAAARQQFALGTPWAGAAGAWYYWAFFVNGATSPAVIRTNTSGLTITNNPGLSGTSAGTPATAFRASSANSGQTTALPGSLGTLSAVAQTWWVAVA